MKRNFILFILFCIFLISIRWSHEYQVIVMNVKNSINFLSIQLPPNISIFLYLGLNGFFLMGIKMSSRKQERKKVIPFHPIKRKNWVKSSYVIQNYTSFILFAIAAILLIIVIATNLNELTNMTLLLVGICCFIIGVILLAFSKGETIDSKIGVLLLTQGIINTCQLYNDLSIHGKAYFIPIIKNVKQYILSDKESPPPVITKLTENYAYCTYTKDNCVIITPTATPLLTLLERENQLIIPNEEELLFIAIKEVIEEILEVGKRVTISIRDGNIFVDIYNFQLFDGCMILQNESPRYCTISPCPICSLITCILARGLNIPVSIEKILLESETRSIHLVLST